MNSGPRTNSPVVVTSGAIARAAVQAAKRSGKKVGLVPTMGALHAGHLSLIEGSCRECQFTAVSIFVNPTQFGPHEDYTKYPRTLDADLKVISSQPVDLVFAPPAEQMYGQNFDTFVVPGKIAEPLEGAARPTHFRGVATVVLKLFQFLPADVAYFGQKDYQQSLVVRRMVADLNLPIQIRVCPIVREPDGLALSSRNIYLKPEERRRALALSQAVRKAEELFRSGERAAAVILSAMHAILAADGEIQVDYIALVDVETLEPVETISTAAVALVAARVGSTRLIDNVILVDRPT